MSKEEISKKINELAREIIALSGNAIFLNLRFLTKAVKNLLPIPYHGTCATDGKFFYYSPVYVLQRYKAGERLVIHDYLHIIIHCVFRHWFVGNGIQTEKWDLASDIAVESLIIDIGLFDNENILEKKRIISELSLKIRPLTAEKLYSYFAELSIEKILEYKEIFHTDDHKFWYKALGGEYEEEEKFDGLGVKSPETSEDEKSQNEDDNSNGSNKNNNDNDENNSSDDNGENNGENDGNNPENTAENGSTDMAEKFSDMPTLLKWQQENRLNELKQLEKLWRDIAKQIQMELGHFNKNAGTESQNFVQMLEEVNRERYDYTDFLKKFSVMGETIKSDMDTFDQTYYSYGLSLYNNIALIEPLEYKEVKLIRDFIIAIDTSGSVSGALVQSFVQKTYNILTSENIFFKKVNIYIIQCDTEIRECVKITCREEFEKYIKNMEIKGLGGTDFRPVFEYVNRLIDNKEFSNLKGLIYFTDGFGEFPAKKPPYDTAFVFMRSDYETGGNQNVPPWAIKLVLEDSDITEVK